MSNILEVKDLCKTYIINKRQNNVLKNVSFSISEGEMVAIMGPSGSGKSTLLYNVSGMDSFTAGSVRFCGNELSDFTESELANLRLDKMGFIFQQMYMLKNLTIFDNILLPSLQSKSNTKSRKEKVEYAQSLMRRLGIIDIADNDINEVSGGQLQRACICRSMINHPEILFADEPTGALNKSAAAEVMEEFIKLNREGTTILLVTHDSKVASRCSRILYLLDGNICGELKLPKAEGSMEKQREETVNNWLMEMGW